MNQFTYDLAVAYRIYPGITKGKHPPPIYPRDKFKLAELCVKSFKKSLGSLKVKIWVLLDNCPPVYESLFTSLWSSQDLTLIHYPGVGDGATLREQTRILMEQTDAGIVFFAEDDYFYLPDQIPLAIEFIKENADADFVAPYEDWDFHTGDMNNLPRKTKSFSGKVWNTSVCTTHTFLCKRDTLIESHHIFSTSYGKISPDLSKWMALTKKRVFNPVKFAWWSITHRWFWAGSVVIAWYFCWRQILFGRKYELWVPHTALATHMASGVESSGVDWAKEFKRYESDSRCQEIN